MNNAAVDVIGTRQKLQADFELLTPKEAAEFLRVSVSFLAKARMRGDGPRFRKLSRAVRYLKSDLAEWLKARARTSTSEF
jgi:predicted DNA-binding transcriptional regulator AlpA